VEKSGEYKIMEKTKCVMCNKGMKVRTWKARKGILKGSTIVSDVFCGKKCKKKFRLLILLNDIIDQLEEL